MIPPTPGAQAEEAFKTSLAIAKEQQGARSFELLASLARSLSSINRPTVSVEAHAVLALRARRLFGDAGDARDRQGIGIVRWPLSRPERNCDEGIDEVNSIVRNPPATAASARSRSERPLNVDLETLIARNERAQSAQSAFRDIAHECNTPVCVAITNTAGGRRVN